MKQLKNAELYRYLKSQNTKIYFVILLVFFLGIAGVMMFQEVSYKETIIEDLLVEKSEGSQGHSRNHLEGQLDFGGDLEAQSRESMKFWTKVDTSVQALLNQYQNDRFPLLYFNRVLAKYYSMIIEGYEKGYSIDIIKIHNPSKEALIRELQVLDYCEYARIPYPKTPNTVNLVNYWTTILSNEYLLGVLLLVIMMNIPLFSRENETGVYKQVYTQSFSREEIVKTKIKISFQYSLIMIAIPFVIASVLIAVFFGLGYFGFPTVINVASIVNLPFMTNSTELAYIGMALLYKVILFVGLVLLMICTCHFVAIYTGSSSTTLAAMAILIAFTYMVGQFVENSNPLKVFWIYGYYRTDAVITNDIPTTVLTFVILTGLVCYVLIKQSVKTMIKKDMTGEVLE